MDALKEGWYSEVNNQWPGQAMSIQIEERLFDARSDYQHVQVFKSKPYGNVLVLDDVTQLTDLDECAYQEMIAHLPLMAHPNPKKVLVIGGGDGGVIREVCKHKSVESVEICEIDKVVIEAGKRFFPNVAAAWDDARVKLIVQDASKYIKGKTAEYDVIIADTSDPEGPAGVLFESEFYRDMFNALKPGGIACNQAESFWLNLDLISNLVVNSSKIFETVEYAFTQIPTYPSGMIGFLLSGKADNEKRSEESEKKQRVGDKKTTSVPAREDAAVEDSCRYYSKEIHSASFVLPKYVTKVIAKAKAGQPTSKEDIHWYGPKAGQV